MKNKLFYSSKIICLLAFSIFPLCGFAQTNNETVSAQKKEAVKILKKPPASYLTSSNETVCATGIVRLRVEFLASGKIGKISVVSGLPYGLSEKAVEAAKKIKFKPATENGLPVTIKKVVEYNFTLY